MTRVANLEQIIDILREQGAKAESSKDLEPAYVGRGGYIGCRVRYAAGEVRTVWVQGTNVVWRARSTGPLLPTTAEWLTRELADADGKLATETIVRRFAKSSLLAGPTLLESLAVLSLAAERMDFLDLDTPYGRTIALPPNHPLTTLRKGKMQPSASLPAERRIASGYHH